jgi:hypothetical protein
MKIYVVYRPDYDGYELIAATDSRERAEKMLKQDNNLSIEELELNQNLYLTYSVYVSPGSKITRCLEGWVGAHEEVKRDHTGDLIITLIADNEKQAQELALKKYNDYLNKREQNDNV